MTPRLSGIARDAWALWRRDRALLVALAGPFLFLPILAWILLAPEPPLKPDMDQAARVQVVLAWIRANAHWIAARIVVEFLGEAAILGLYLGRGFETVGGLLRRSLELLPLYVLAVVATWLLMGLGAMAFILPGLYLLGRLALTGPVVVAEPGAGMTGAIGRSLALTRGFGWLIFGYLGLTFLAGMAAAEVLGGMRQGLAAAGAVNPIALSLIAMAGATAATAATLARLLLVVAIYRRLTTPR